jgi:predicted AAA+ superfamily ATPase
MPHLRSRYSSQLIQDALKHSSVVGVLGQRQVGKTTVVSNLANEYVTFDASARLDEANAYPEKFLANRELPFGIDEAQLCPRLFPAVKEWVRLHPKKGQFIFTGSVRFTSRKLIRESLTGRIVNVEILPLSVSELDQLPLPNRIEEALKIHKKNEWEQFIRKFSKCTEKKALHFLDTGGLPGICFFRNETVRQARFEAQLDTLLNRDLRLVLQTTLSFLQLRKLAVFLAENQGSPIELKTAARACQSTTTTVKKLIFAYESLFLIRMVPSEGTVIKNSYFFEDQGMASHLAKNELHDHNNILRVIYANLRQELFYRPHPKNEIFSYRTHDGAEVPLAFRTTAGELGIIPNDESTPTLKALASARSFCATYSRAKVIIACKGGAPETRDFQILALPYWKLLG